MVAQQPLPGGAVGGSGARSRKRSMAAGAGGLLAAALLLAVAGPPPAPAELTDGNSEHLKREHSLMKPYQGERGARRDGTGREPRGGPG